MVGCAECADWKAKYHALVLQVIDLKRDGFGPPPAMPTLDAPPPLPEDVQHAIQAVSAANSPEERRLHAWAAEQLSRKRSPEDVAQHIRQGEKVGWEEP